MSNLIRDGATLLAAPILAQEIPAADPAHLSTWLVDAAALAAMLLVFLKVIDHFKRKPSIEEELEKLLRQLRDELNQVRAEQSAHISEMRARIEGAHQRVDHLTHDLNNKLQRLPAEIVDLLHKTGVITPMRPAPGAAVHDRSLGRPPVLVDATPSPRPSDNSPALMKSTAQLEPPYTDPCALLQARILKILKPCLEYWLDEQTLYLTLNLSRPPVARLPLDVALRELRDKAYLDFRVDPLSRLTEWRLTPSGRALAQPL